MEPMLIGQVFVALLVYIFVVPILAKVALKGIALDAKLDPEEGEDESRLLLVPPEQLKIEEKKQRLERSLSRRWLRAANYRKENIERAIAGRPVDNCPRLTRAKRNLRKTLKEDHVKAAERKEAWRENEDNYKHELDLRRAKREIEADANYLATITIDDIECERAIIGVDSEGMDGGPETIIERGGVKWPDHYSILWGASGVGFTKARQSRGSSLAQGPTDHETRPRDNEVGRVLDLPSVWAGYEDKRPLDGIEIVELLLSLPDRYGRNCSFVAFSFNYDVTMLLKLLRQGRSKNWHYDRVWEICKRKDKETEIGRNNTIYIGKYAISYIKSKVLIIHELDDENNVLRRVTIFDVFGFYQTSFVKVVSSLVPLGLATEEEVEKMRQNKARRSDFNSPEWPLERIKAYTVEELRKLSAAVTVLRKAAFDEGIRMNRLDGAGNLSAGIMRREKVMRHYKGLMQKYDARNEQLIGYHADFGGRIELVQQGFDEHGICYKYDEKSSYPHKCIILPSMIGGFWVKRRYGEFGWADIEAASPISMFQVRWHLPERYIDAHGNMQIVPFYALPYRLKAVGSDSFQPAGDGISRMKSCF